MPACTLCTSFVFCLRTTRLFKLCPLLITHSLDSRFLPRTRATTFDFDALFTSTHVLGEMDRLQTLLAGLSHLDLEGQIIDGKALLGFGGTCDVFVAWSQKHRTKVAVKRIRAFMLEDESFAKVRSTSLSLPLRRYSFINDTFFFPLEAFGKRNSNLVSAEARLCASFSWFFTSKRMEWYQIWSPSGW